MTATEITVCLSWKFFDIQHGSGISFVCTYFEVMFLDHNVVRRSVSTTKLITKATLDTFHYIHQIMSYVFPHCISKTMSFFSKQDFLGLIEGWLVTKS